MKQQQGFTLIELIVVIVILGILAATALPKFSNLAVDARIAKMHGLTAALKASATMAHGQSLAEQIASNVPVTLEDGSIITMQYYYPDVTTTSGIQATLDMTGNGYASGANIANPGIAWDFYPDAGRTNCVVTYYQATTVSGISSVPTVNESALASSVAAANCT